MDPQLITILIAIAGAVGSAFAFIAGRRERKASALASEGTAAAQISEGYMNLVESLERRVKTVEKDNEELRKSVEILTEERDELRKELKKLTAKMARLERGLTNGGNGS